MLFFFDPAELPRLGDAFRVLHGDRARARNRPRTDAVSPRRATMAGMATPIRRPKPFAPAADRFRLDGERHD